MSQLKRYNGTDWETIGGLVTGDTLPLGSEVNYNGEYCPAGWVEISDPNEYTTSQKIDTGKKLNGKTIYKKFIDFTHANTGDYSYNHNLNIETIFNITAYCTVAGQTYSVNGYRPMPYLTDTTHFFRIGAIKQNTIDTTAGTWTNNHAYIWIEYTEAS